MRLRVVKAGARYRPWRWLDSGTQQRHPRHAHSQECISDRIDARAAGRYSCIPAAATGCGRGQSGAGMYGNAATACGEQASGDGVFPDHWRSSRGPGRSNVQLAQPGVREARRGEQGQRLRRFKSTFLAQAGRGGATGARGPAAGPTPPSGNAFEIVTAECDTVTIVHQANRQDHTAEPGKFHEVFTFDTFGVKDGSW